MPLAVVAPNRQAWFVQERQRVIGEIDGPDARLSGYDRRVLPGSLGDPAGGDGRSAARPRTNDNNS
jgi:hypothetical protein